jgi:hypothetical protein
MSESGADCERMMKGEDDDLCKLQAENAELRKERDALQARIDGGIRVVASEVDIGLWECCLHEETDATLIIDEGVTL